MSHEQAVHGQTRQIEPEEGRAVERESDEHRAFFSTDLGIEELVAEFGGRRSRRSIEDALKSVASDALTSVVAPFATLLLLRLMEHLDADRESASASGNAGCRPLLTPNRHWTAWCRLEGEDLCRFFRRQLVPALERAPNVTWARTLRPLAKVLASCHTIPPAYWSRLISWVELYDLSGQRGRADAGKALQELTVDTSDVERFATTPHLADLMVALLDPKPGRRIYDPCFGTGGLLAGAVRTARSVGDGGAGAEQQTTAIDGVFGVEIDPYAYIVGTAQVALAGASGPGLGLRDALDGTAVANGTFEGADYIIAHPPWGLKRPDAAGRWPVPTPDLAMLFLQHTMESLNPGGRAVVALHDSALYRLGLDREIRRILLTEYLVEGVVAIPHRGLPHFSYASTDVSVLVFSRSRPASTVRFLSVPDHLRGHVGHGPWEVTVVPPRQIAAKFRSGKPDGSLWDTPLESIAKRDWDLCAKRTGNSALVRLLAQLSDSTTRIETTPLGSVADVTMGTPSKADAEPQRVGVVVRVVRAADITDSGVRRWETGISELGKAPRDTRPERDASYPLCTGDVLLTIAGNIGRVGVLDEMEEASVAGHGVAVIRPSPALSPAFLKYLLASDAYQNWLRGHSRGPIQRLSLGKLLKLPVPVPPMESQEQVVSRLPGDRGDPLAAIIRVLSDTHDPIVEWLAESEEVRQLIELNDTTDVAALLDGIGGSMQRLSMEIANTGAAAVPELGRWLDAVGGAIAVLHGIAHTPRGLERLAILDGVALQLERLAKPGDRPSWEVALAHRVTDRIVEVAGIERGRILSDVAVEADIERNWAAPDSGSEIQLRLTNRSRLPLRSFEAFTDPQIGGARTAYLAVGATLNVPLRIPSDAPVGSYQFTVRWRAARLDGHQTGDSIPLAVEIQAGRSADRIREIGSSPYIVGSPIDRKEMLFGREATIEEIRRQLRSDSRANVVLLEGLQLEDARRLVTQPADGRLVYVPEARDLVVQLCARQPFLIQSLCNRIFETAARSKRRTVTVDDVATAAEAMIEDNEHFRTLWGYAGTERRRFLLALFQKLGDHGPITLDLLERNLRRRGVHLHRGERLGDDLEFLRELEMLELHGTRSGSAYRLTIPLMARWIEQNEDFENQRRRAVEEFEEADRGDGYWDAAEEDE